MQVESVFASSGESRDVNLGLLRSQVIPLSFGALVPFPLHNLGFPVDWMCLFRLRGGKDARKQVNGCQDVRTQQIKRSQSQLNEATLKNERGK